MSQDRSTPPPKRGRPRSEAARRAILDAAYEILLDVGLGRLTIEAVAARAGVGKPTIYRSWANAQELAMAALMAAPAPPDAADAGGQGAIDALRAHLAHVLRVFATPRGRQITLTMAAADEKSEIARAFRNQIILKMRDTGRQLLTEAEERGEVAPIADLDAALDALYGPIFYRILAGHRQLTPDFGDAILSIVLDGVARRRK